MSIKIFLTAYVAVVFCASYINAECANGCNGHGKCTSYDMCICNRNWQANDCSERVCLFGLAHVDTPKGDLDMSGALTGPGHPVIDNSFTYPYGTTEQFPQMEDSDLNILTESAHYYMECSNKGTCDRTTGECVCYDGYDGVACQRASCPGFPNSCSGHGVCKSKKQLAQSDHGNIYKLWDKDSTMGCECDAGYYGADCSLKTCKYGVDPLYIDDSATIKYSTFDFATLTTAKTIDFTDGSLQAGKGHWAIRFFDSNGEDWLTRPIVAGASCSAVVDALEALPNSVIPSGMTYCTLSSKAHNNTVNWKSHDAQHTVGSKHIYDIYYNLSIWEAEWPANAGDMDTFSAPRAINKGESDPVKNMRALSGYIYRLKFYGNPGALKQPQIELYLDGKRPSLVSPNGKVITKVWTDGQQGENNDYFADHCDKVTATIKQSGNNFFLSGLSSAEKALLKACLADSDFDTTNNIGVYNWDMGSVTYPHMIKLVRSVTTYTDGGYYAALYFDPTAILDDSGAGVFRLVNPFLPPDELSTDNYEIYTTKGTLALTSNASQAIFSFASNVLYTVNTTYDTTLTKNFDGDLSCETGSPHVAHCLNKTDLITVLTWERPELNPPHINLYSANRLYTHTYEWSVQDRFLKWQVGSRLGGQGNDGYAYPSDFYGKEMHYMTNTITLDLSTNWAASVPNYSPFRVYKFFPAAASTYNYVNECSNRGICGTDTGICSCFPGYTNDDCSVQNSIAL